MRFAGLCHRVARGRTRLARMRPPAIIATWMRAAHVIIPIAALTGLVAACGTPAATRPRAPRTGCTQARAPVAMIADAPGPVTAPAKPVADVIRSARFTRALAAAEPEAGEELRSAEQRLSADARVFAAHTTARAGRAVAADLRAIRTYCP